MIPRLLIYYFAGFFLVAEGIGHLDTSRIIGAFEMLLGSAAVMLSISDVWKD